VRDFEPDNIYSVWDKKLLKPSTNFRKEMVNVEYKANRDYSELEEIHAKDDLIMSMLQALGIKIMFPRVMEGDDVIAWLTHNLPGEKTIVSVDHDFFQLVNEQTSVFSPIKKVLVEQFNLAEHTKVNPNCFILFKAIKGDVSDNVPGLEGFGAVKSKKLAEGWETLQNKLTTEQKEIVTRNIKLVDLSYGYKVYPEEIESYKGQLEEQQNIQLNMKEFKRICTENHIDDIVYDFLNWIHPFRHDNLLQDSIVSLAKRLNLTV
jgi:5'-3' exonuclease